MSGFVDLASFGHKCCLGCGEGSLQIVSEVGGGTAATLDDCQGIVGYRDATIILKCLNRSVQNCLSVS
jgi:hypothetical protein